MDPRTVGWVVRSGLIQGRYPQVLLVAGTGEFDAKRKVKIKIRTQVFEDVLISYPF